MRVVNDMQITDIKENSVFGVIGVCGVNGNLIARILIII